MFDILQSEYPAKEAVFAAETYANIPSPLPFVVHGNNPFEAGPTLADVCLVHIKPVLLSTTQLFECVSVLLFMVIAVVPEYRPVVRMV